MVGVTVEEDMGGYPEDGWSDKASSLTEDKKWDPRIHKQREIFISDKTTTILIITINKERE